MNFLKKHKGRMVVALVTIILIIIIGVTAGGRENATVVESVLGKLLNPIQKLFYNGGESITTTFKSIGDISQLKTENTELKEEISKLQSQLRKYEDIISRSDYLRNEAILKDKTEFNLVDAQIIGKDPGNWFDRFIIDKGLKNGIKKNDAVIQGVVIDGDTIVEGLVGRVIEVGDDWAKVISIIDEGSNVSFNVIRTQDGGIVKGDFEGNLSGYLFDAKADIVKGDKLLTSGLGGVFVKDLYIGEISEVTKSSEDLLVNIKVDSAVNFNKLQDVFVIVEN